MLKSFTCLLCCLHGGSTRPRRSTRVQQHMRVDYEWQQTIFSNTQPSRTLRLRYSNQYHTNTTLSKSENVILAVGCPLILRFTTPEKVHFLEFLPVNSKPWNLELIFLNMLFNRNTCFWQQFYLNRTKRFNIKFFQKLKTNFWRVFLPNRELVLKNVPTNSTYTLFRFKIQPIAKWTQKIANM